MFVSKSSLVNGVLVAVIAAGTLAATSAAAKSYVVCNAYNECWKVHERYKTYPADLHIVFHNDTWWTSHQHDTTWKFEADPTDDHGWYDKDGTWRAFEPHP
jgi:hypothetical protein